MTHRFGQVASTVALVIALALVPAALAAKGGTGGKGHGGTTTAGSSSISQPVMVTDVGTPGLSSGDTITFNVSTTATTTPWVNLLCYQNGALVYNGWVGFWDGSLYPTWNFSLTSTAWKSGAADCVAWLDMYTKQGYQRLASSSFNVGA